MCRMPDAGRRDDAEAKGSMAVLPQEMRIVSPE